VNSFENSIATECFLQHLFETEAGSNRDSVRAQSREDNSRKEKAQSKEDHLLKKKKRRKHKEKSRPDQLVQAQDTVGSVFSSSTSLSKHEVIKKLTT
jgi:hypothetical protein